MNSRNQFFQNIFTEGCAITCTVSHVTNNHLESSLKAITLTSRRSPKKDDQKLALVRKPTGTREPEVSHFTGNYPAVTSLLSLLKTLRTESRKLRATQPYLKGQKRGLRKPDPSFCPLRSRLTCLLALKHLATTVDPTLGF